MKRWTISLIFAVALFFTGSVFAQGRGEIMSAEYGSGRNWHDVTEIVRGLLEANQPNFKADDPTLIERDDGISGEQLRLQVRMPNGRVRRMVYQENQNVALQGYTVASDTGGGGILEIERAEWGVGNQRFDVTDRLNARIRGDILDMQVTNDTMGGDPAYGQAKTLSVWYRYDGQPRRVTINEGDYLSLPNGGRQSQGRFNRGGRWEQQNRAGLYVTQATYGSDRRRLDVTNMLNEHIRNGQLSMRVTNETMGADPAYGEAKTLMVWYAYNGRRDQVVINEGGYLNLPKDFQSSTGSSPWLR
jgi:hypothetical protein